ncbi:NAD(+)/NADH kinase [Gemmiger sp.]|uniref:NAD(+)/NADH kinase n=1 Tax=Gemmiger sp. TaxID=2049027 RepID=UPI00294244BE|nr:NAD(+)/NADH kinase [uncultured Gemmiger sp.]MBS6783304.1 NAD(+)/NADH kinase [Subdoligranulum variabile]
MSVLLIPNPTKDTGLAVTRQAAAVLAGRGIPVLMPQAFAAADGLDGVRFLPEEQAYRAAEQVVTIGGDGTLLRAGLDCLAHGKPVLGVNLGRTGFLATCEVGELATKLNRLAAGDFTLVERGLLHARVPAHDWAADAINDIVLFGNTRLHPMDYKVYCDGAFVGSYRSDGMILATPTGSTAYSFSAGGPILDAAADVMVLTPVCAHNAHVAPLVFAASRKLEIIADAENRDGSFACADSSNQCSLLPGESLLVTGGGQHLQLITFDDAEQFHAIENKLMRR